MYRIVSFSGAGSDWLLRL